MLWYMDNFIFILIFVYFYVYVLGFITLHALVCNDSVA